MFSGCESLKKLNLSNLEPYFVGDMSYMFRNCISLQEINLTNLKQTDFCHTFGMLGACPRNYRLRATFEAYNLYPSEYAFSDCPEP